MESNRYSSLQEELIMKILSIKMETIKSTVIWVMVILFMFYALSYSFKVYESVLMNVMFRGDKSEIPEILSNETFIEGVCDSPYNWAVEPAMLDAISSENTYDGKSGETKYILP